MQIFILKEVRVQVRNPFGPVDIEVDFDEVGWRDSNAYTARRTLSDAHLTTKDGWRNMFTHVGPFFTRMGGVIKVDMRKYGIVGRWQRGKIQKTVTGIGNFKFEREDLRITFVVAEYK